MTEQSSTQIAVIVKNHQQVEPTGSILHKFIIDHFASEQFIQYGANRELDESLLQQISCELTCCLRNDPQIRVACNLSDETTATCYNAKGFPIKDSPTNDNMIIFSVDVV